MIPVKGPAFLPENFFPLLHKADFGIICSGMDRVVYYFMILSRNKKDD